jgi:hypothetical protein
VVDHPRIPQVFIPTGACWLNLQEGWWRLVRRRALAGQCFASPEGTLAAKIATCQLNTHARGVGPPTTIPPPPTPRPYLPD